MANIIDSNGLTINSLAEIITNLEDGYRIIYGSNISLGSNTPDGQKLNLFAQSVRDLLEFAQSVHNNFDPDQAIGVIQDQRYSMNNLQRKAGTRSTQQVDITVDRSLTLNGIDSSETTFTVKDDLSNEFELAETIALLEGTTTLLFRTVNIGALVSLANTITTPVTVVLGITAINNPTGVLSVGTNEETDTEFRLRRIKSVANSSTGYLDGLIGNILNIADVEQAKVLENVSATIDSDGIPPHSIWLIVLGGTSADIGNILYANKSYGSDMRGAQLENIATASGGIFVAKFDRPADKDLYIRFTIQGTVTGQSFDQAGIKDYFISNLSYNISEAADSSTAITTAVAAIASTGGGGIPILMELSPDGVVWSEFEQVDTPDEIWRLDVSRITITEVPAA